MAKNRDRTYEPITKVIHHTDPKNELVFLFDETTNYVEGMNVKTGICILNVAVENGLDYAGTASREGANIFRALTKAKKVPDAVRMLMEKNYEVYGNTMVCDGNSAYLLEFAKDLKPVLKNISKNKLPTVRTNHTLHVPDGGYSLSDEVGIDYISTKTRKAVAEVMFKNAGDIKALLDSLNYKLFGSHSAYDTHRNTSSYKTVSQIAVDPANKKLYYRPIPGRETFKGVERTGDISIEPSAEVVVLEYGEPVEVPFLTWSASMHPQMNEIALHRILDPTDKFDDTRGMNDIDAEKLRTDDFEDNLDYFIDRENEIITKLASIQDLIRNKDTAMLHLLSDRDADEEYDRICDMIDDFELKTMDLYSLQSKEKARTQNEAARKPRKKGQHKGSSSHSDLYTDEDPKGTIHGLGFKDAATAKKGVATVNKAKRKHAHKVQATLVMQQRAKVAKERAKDPEKKKNLNAAYKIWSAHLEKLKAKTKKMNESHLRKYIRSILKEQEELTLPKNQWELLASGDPRREAAKEQLFDLVQQTYEPIGGHFKISSPGSLDRYTYWIVKDIDEDPDIDVAIFGKPDVGGHKLGAAANDGSAAASSEYKNKSAELRAGGEVAGVGNWWGEVSGKPAYAMISRGAMAVEDEGKVAELLAGDDFVFHGEHPDPNAPAVFKSVKGWYTKKFGDKSSTKIILGNPK